MCKVISSRVFVYDGDQYELRCVEAHGGYQIAPYRDGCLDACAPEIFVSNEDLSDLQKPHGVDAIDAMMRTAESKFRENRGRLP